MVHLFRTECLVIKLNEKVLAAPRVNVALNRDVPTHQTIDISR